MIVLVIVSTVDDQTTVSMAPFRTSPVRQTTHQTTTSRLALVTCSSCLTFVLFLFLLQSGQLVSGNAPLSLNVALKFVIHFIGDIHQPLHVGFTSDEGGNTQIGTFEGTYGRRLHQVWDEDMIEKRINDDYQGDNSTYLQYFMNRIQSGDWKNQVSEWQACPSSEPSNINACSISWAQQSVGLACSTAYVDQDGNKIQDGFDLEDPYYNFAYPVAELQIARGGIRLANVINAIFALPSMTEYVVTRQEFRRAQQIALW